MQSNVNLAVQTPGVAAEIAEDKTPNTTRLFALEVASSSRSPGGSVATGATWPPPSSRKSRDRRPRSSARPPRARGCLDATPLRCRPQDYGIAHAPPPRLRSPLPRQPPLSQRRPAVHAFLFHHTLETTRLLNQRRRYPGAYMAAQRPHAAEPLATRALRPRQEMFISKYSFIHVQDTGLTSNENI